MTNQKNYLIAIILAVIAIACSTPEQKEAAPISIPDVETIAPEDVGFSVDSLVKIDSMIKKYVDKGFIPGASILVARHGKIAYETVYGWRDREEEIPMQKGDLFRLASMTKPLTSAAILQLYEAGKLDVNDPVSKYIPEFANPTVLESYNEADTTWESRPAVGEVTLSHLLTHTAGLKYGFLDPAYGAIYAKNGIPGGVNPFDLTTETTMATLGTMPLAFDPGTAYNYGLSTDVLGRVVEVASNQKLDDYVAQNITNKLGLEDIWYFSKDTVDERLVTCYAPLGDTAIAKINADNDPNHQIRFPLTGKKSYLSGGSGMTGTARDYFVFCQTMLNGGKWGDSRILQDSTVNLMRTNQIDTITYPWGPGKFGYGFHVVTEDNPQAPKQRVGRFSWGGIFHTVFWIDPSRDVIAILMSQVISNPNRDQINGEFENLVNNALVNEER